MANEEKRGLFGRASGSLQKRADRPRRNPIKAFKKWFREMKSELKKVIWPTPKQITHNTGVALCVMFLFAIVLWGFDSLAQAGVQALITVAG